MQAIALTSPAHTFRIIDISLVYTSPVTKLLERRDSSRTHIGMITHRPIYITTTDELLHMQLVAYLLIVM